MNKRPAFLAVLSLTVLLTGCPELGQRWDDRSQQLEVDFYRAPCSNDGQQLCYRIRETDSEPFVVSAAPWLGFDSYAWGNRYRTEVITSFNKDGSPSGYDLQQVISSSDRSSEAFALTLYSRSGILQPSGAQWLLGNDITLDCGSNCAELTSAVNAAEVVRLELQVSGTALVLNELLCRSAEDDVAQNCDGESEQEWQIAPFMSDCGLAVASMCLLYRTDNSSPYELLRLEEGITGFTYTWGQRYELTVRQTLTNAGALQAAELLTDDATPESQNGRDNAFRFIVRGAALAASSGDRVVLYGGAGVEADAMPALDCGTNGLCTQLNRYSADDEYLLLRAYQDATDSRLVLESIPCHAVGLTSFRSCVANDSDVNWSI